MSRYPPQPDPKSEPPRRPFDPSILLRSRSLLAEGDAEGAMQCLRPVFDDHPAHAQLRSQYGLAMGLARRRYHEALDLCQSAVKQEFFNPDLYVNVARLNLAYGFKGEALRYLRRARMIDPANQAIAELFEHLGARSAPVLPFLPRRHLLNRWLGSARAIFLARRTWGEAESDRHSQADHLAA